MDRRDFIKSLSAVPFIPSIDWNSLSDDYFRYYFGGFATGKTTRLINDAANWLMINPGTHGLFVLSIYPLITYARRCIRNLPRINRAEFSKLHSTLYFPNESTLKFIAQEKLWINQIMSYSFQGLWTDYITQENREFLQYGLQAGYEGMNAHTQHVISMDEAHDLHDQLGLKPVLISSSNSYVEGIGRLWGFR